MRQAHGAEHMAAGVRLGRARGTVRNRGEIAPGVDRRFRIDAPKRDIDHVCNRPFRLAIDHRVERCKPLDDQTTDLTASSDPDLVLLDSQLRSSSKSRYQM